MITRNREVNGTDIWQMKDPGAGDWYILETNYDHWENPFILDDRRGPANRCMKTKAQKVTRFKQNTRAQLFKTDDAVS